MGLLSNLQIESQEVQKKKRKWNRISLKNYVSFFYQKKNRVRAYKIKP